jgi:hypothetical protein
MLAVLPDATAIGTGARPKERLNPRRPNPIAQKPERVGASPYCNSHLRVQHASTQFALRVTNTDRVSTPASQLLLLVLQVRFALLAVAMAPKIAALVLCIM